MKIIVLYATQTGTSEYLAENLLEEQDNLSQIINTNNTNTFTNNTIEISSIDNFENYLSEEYISQQHVDNTDNNNVYFLFIVSTVSDGCCPYSMDDFIDWIKTESAKNFIKNTKSLQYSIFGVGNSLYVKTYQKASRDLKEILLELKEPFISCEEGDQAEVNVDEQFNVWKSNLLNYFK
ncbi:hypothetical protein ABK040_004232 [Willaertia magna]